MTGFEAPLARSALREVVDLHGFFEDWLGGTGPDSADAFDRLESALAETFTMVAPDGRRRSRTEVLAWLRQAYGSRGGRGPFRIEIQEPELLYLDPPLVLLGYVEVQSAGGALTRRRSTALLAAAPGERPRWLALHETWTDADG